MEHLGRDPDVVFGTVHGPEYSGALGLSNWTQQSHDIADDFHVFAVEWDADGIRWFYDDEFPLAMYVDFVRVYQPVAGSGEEDSAG